MAKQHGAWQVSSKKWLTWPGHFGIGWSHTHMTPSAQKKSPSFLHVCTCQQMQFTQRLQRTDCWVKSRAWEAKMKLYELLGGCSSQFPKRAAAFWVTNRQFVHLKYLHHIDENSANQNQRRPPNKNQPHLFTTRPWNSTAQKERMVAKPSVKGTNSRKYMVWASNDEFPVPSSGDGCRFHV